MHLLSCVTLATAVMTLASCCATTPAEPAEREAEREIRELEAQYNAAVLKADRAFFERVLADEFTHTSHSGKLKTKAQWLSEPQFSESQTDPKPAKATYDSYEIDDMAIRIYANTAVVTGRTTPAGRTAKGEPITGQFRFIRVWVRKEGRWQAVAFQGTRLGQ